MASLIGLALAWQYTRLSDYTDIGYVASVISRHAQSAFAPLFAVAAFVLGGLVAFPVIVLIAATAAALGPWIGGLSATAGVLLSSLLLFMIGRFLGHKRLQSLLGGRALRQRCMELTPAPSTQEETVSSSDMGSTNTGNDIWESMTSDPKVPKDDMSSPTETSETSTVTASFQRKAGGPVQTLRH
jgi:hypothetical protein